MERIDGIMLWNIKYNFFFLIDLGIAQILWKCFASMQDVIDEFSQQRDWIR